MKHIGQIDTSHDMYQPDKRAKRLRSYERGQTTEANQRPDVTPDPRGSKAEREAWMRELQLSTRINRQMESDLIAAAYSELERTRIRRKMMEIELDRIKKETQTK